MVDYRCWNKHGEEGLNEVEMRDSYLEREVPTYVEENHDDDVNELDVLGFTDDDIEFQVHNIEEMVRNVERHGDNDLPWFHTSQEVGMVQCNEVIASLSLQFSSRHSLHGF
jgi:hypothetical protein